MRWICRRKFKHFGENAEMRPFSYAICASRISIGKNVKIHPGTMLFAEGGSIVIEDDVAMGSGVHCYVSNHNFNRRDIPIKLQGHSPAKPVHICRGAWIGANAIILAGIKVGINSVVGAGAVVTKDVDDYTVVGGVPARVIRRIG
jgi:acetyltransferase-like isoleucine patch superfamily enzyme